MDLQDGRGGVERLCTGLVVWVSSPKFVIHVLRDLIRCSRYRLTGKSPPCSNPKNHVSRTDDLGCAKLQITWTKSSSL